MPKKILFISRKYPPSIGGMQSYTKNLLDNLKSSYDVDAILLCRGQIHLFWFLPFTFFKAILLDLKNRYDVLCLADALLAPLGLAIKKIFRLRAIVTAHGLDITYKNFLYQKIVPPAVARFDRVVCVSRNTIKECTQRNIHFEICTFIPNGINIDEYYLNLSQPECRDLLGKEWRCDFSGKKLIFTVGRLVPRKGVDWFIENIFIKLEKDFVYLVCGQGPLKKKIEAMVAKLSLQGRVMLLGQVRQRILQLIYNCADIFVMPNQKIENSPEGFGIVAIEAASCGLPVIANNIDGLSDAVIDGKTGWLIKYNDRDAFIEKIKNPGLDRANIRENAKVFSWPSLIGQYREVIDKAQR